MGNSRIYIYKPSIMLLVGLWLTAFGWALADSGEVSEGLLLSPVKGTIIDTFPIYFNWNDVSGAYNYEIQIDNNENFSSPVADYEAGYSNYSVYSNVFPEFTVYYWRIRTRFYSAGNYFWGEWCRPWYFIIPDQSTDASDIIASDTPDKFKLEQNYPNPFNSSTTVEYFLPRASFVTLDIYNILGQKIKTIEEGSKKSGYQQTIWDGTDRDNSPVSSGIYFYRLRAGEYVAARKMLLMK